MYHQVMDGRTSATALTLLTPCLVLIILSSCSSFRVILSIAKDLKTCTEEKLFLAEEFRKVAEALVE